MIPKHKIEMAADKVAIQYDHNTDKEVAFNEFMAGVSFAETELQLITIEFAEWCAINKYQYNETYKYWHDGRITYKSDTLFSIFMSERPK